MSEILDVPCLSFARKVVAADGTVTVERQTATGYETVSTPTPAVIAVTNGAVEPRYPTFKGIMQAKSKPLTTTTAAELGVDNAPRQKIVSVDAVASRAAGDILEDDGEAYTKIIELLEQVKVI
jgi:electron transfer flavoprotein beta subunit